MLFPGLPEDGLTGTEARFIMLVTLVALISVILFGINRLSSTSVDV
jgi:hypothetical protein